MSQEQGLTLIYAFDDAAVEAGQGTLGLELQESVPQADAVLETRDAAHGDEVCAHLERHGYSRSSPGPGPFDVPVRYFVSKEAEWEHPTRRRGAR